MPEAATRAARRVPLLWKITTLVVGLIVVVMGIQTAIIVSREVKAKRQEMRNTAQVIAQMTGFSVGRHLDRDHQRELDYFAELIGQQFLGVQYLVLYDKNGGRLSQFVNPKVRSWLGGVEPYTREALERQSRKEMRVVLRGSAELVRPVSIYSEDLGWIHLGFSTESLKEEIRRILSRAVFLTAAMTLVALLASFALAAAIARPIRRLAAAAQLVGAGNLTVRAEVTTRDEVGTLTEEFNRMTQNLQERIDDLEALQKLSARISSILERTELYNLIASSFAEWTMVARVSILEWADDDPESLEVRAGVGLEESGLWKFFRVKRGQGLAGVVAESGMDEQVDDISDLPDWQQFYPPAEGKRRHPIPMLAIPLIVKTEVKGVLLLAEPRIPDSFKRENRLKLRTLATHAAVALENARLYDEAITDGLTRVFVHRYFQFRLEEEVKHSTREKATLSLIMIDIDHFKKLNDTYGHQQGDSVLIEMAKIMKNVVRTVDVAGAKRRPDIVARYGGEEFVIILPETDAPSAHAVAERLRATVEAFEFVVTAGQEDALRCSISVGVAEWGPGLAREELIARADRAMYRSKHSGRNRVSVYDSGVDGEVAAKEPEHIRGATARG